MNSAVDGDLVEVELLPERKFYDERDRRGPSGRIVAVLKRNRAEFVGELLSGNRIQPMDRRLPEEIFLHGPRKGAKKGDWLKLSLDEVGDRTAGATVKTVIGKVGCISSDLDAVMAEYDLLPPYSEEEEQQALEVEAREIARTDLTGIRSYAIDPVDAKDYDDALSILPGADERTIVAAVHISDVAAFIAPKSRFDRAAGRRAFSTYLPGRTLPMLPKALTAKISLGGSASSLAHTVLLTVDKATGQVLSSRRAHSRIKLCARLNYDDVQTFFDTGHAPESWDELWQADLSALRQTAQKMREYRAKTEKFLDLPLPEISVQCDVEQNQILGLQVKKQREAEQLVEEYMLAANSAVGAELLADSVAGIFRVHPDPEPEKLLEFSEQMEQSFGMVTGDLTSRKNLLKFLASLPDDAKKPLILNQLLRSLTRAGYGIKAQWHYALGKTAYCHFTSPIRRYPDLVVHQQLWNFDAKVRTRSGATLEKLAAYCCEREEKADAAYFAATDRLKLRYLSEQLDSGAENFYEGVIVRTTASGAQVELLGLGLYGFVPNEQLYRGLRRRDRERSGAYKVGDCLYVRLARIDWATGRAILIPAGR